MSHMIRSKSNSDYKFQRRHNDSWLPATSDTFDAFTQTSLQWMEQQMKLKLHRFVTTDNNLNILYVWQTIQIDIHFATRIENKLLKNVEKKYTERQGEKKLLQVKMLKWKRFQKRYSVPWSVLWKCEIDNCQSGTVTRRWMKNDTTTKSQSIFSFDAQTSKQHFVTNFIKNIRTLHCSCKHFAPFFLPWSVYVIIILLFFLFAD